MRPLVRRSLGVSIRGDRVAFVALEAVAGLVRYRGSGTLPLPPAGEGAAAVRGAGAGRPHVGPWTRPPHEVTLGLPRRSVVMRAVDLPSPKHEDLAGLLRYEIERHVPFPPEQAWYAFQRLSRNGQKARLLVIAAKRAEVERQTELLAQLGVQPTAVDVSPFAAANALRCCGRSWRTAPVCLVEIAGQEAEVSLLEAGWLQASRGVLLGDRPVDTLLGEIGRATAGAARPPARVLLCGGDDGIRADLQRGLAIPVECWRPPHPACPAASTYGLALRGLRGLPHTVDLLPVERRPRRTPGKTAMLALLVLVAGLSAALGLRSAARERGALAEITARVAAARAEAQRVEALRAEVAQLRSHLRVLESLHRDRDTALRVLKELFSLLPAGALLSDVSVEGGKVTVRGTTAGSASELIAAFEKSAVFENAAFASPIASAGKDRQGFHLQVFLRAR